MNWKPSKRQALLKKRLVYSSRTYWRTSRQLDQMLLKMLHSDGIYTPDDLHNWYINGHSDSTPRQIVPLQNDSRTPNQNVTNDQIDHALINLSLALTQLKNVIDKHYLNDRK